MMIAPLADNLLTSGTISTAAQFEPAHPGARALRSDPNDRAYWRGNFTTDINANKVDFDEGGGPLVATVASLGPYLPVEWITDVASAMTTAGGDTYTGTWLQGSTDRHRFRLSSTGTFSLQNNTGPNKATSALVNTGGYSGDYDRASASAHTGDFACIHRDSERLEVDLASAKTADASFIAGLDASLGARVYVRAGLTANPSDETHPFVDSIDRECMAVFYSSPVNHRYVALHIANPRREDSPRVGLGYWYHGPVLDTNDIVRDGGALEWEVPSYRRELTQRGTMRRDVVGHPHFAELTPGESVAFAFAGSPGLAPSSAHALESLIVSLGRSNLAFVALDPTREPHRETRLVRFTEVPPLTRFYAESPAGRWSLPFRFEVEEVAI